MNLLREFRGMGRMLSEQGIISATAGNISICREERIYITASGSFLGDLEYGDIVDIPLDGRELPYRSHPVLKKKASVEAVVHRSIYLNTAHRAVAHGHAPHALALASFSDRIRFEDAEGKLCSPEIPVLTCKTTIGSEEVAAAVPGYLKTYPAVVIRDHGVFSAADTLRNACSVLSTVEFSSRIIVLKRICGKV